MSDLMQFPETWEEFEASYGFTDSDEVYTNGARLIPSFRVEQWLEHIDPVKHGNWVSKNGWVSCSVCGLEPPNESNETSDYCPNCGARMDEPKQISAEFAKLMTEGEIRVWWRKEEEDAD